MKYCSNCNDWVAEDSNICPNCGSQTTEFTEMYPQTDIPSFGQHIEKLANDALKWGIMSVAFALSGFLSFLGIFFAAKANEKAAEYVHYMSALSGKAKVGKYLAKGGLIGGIVMTAEILLLIIFYIFLIWALSTQPHLMK